jgi:hypothetical protein
MPNTPQMTAPVASHFGKQQDHQREPGQRHAEQLIEHQYRQCGERQLVVAEPAHQLRPRTASDGQQHEH